jgi:hypothetical protein
VRDTSLLGRSNLIRIVESMACYITKIENIIFKHLENRYVCLQISQTKCFKNKRKIQSQQSILLLCPQHATTRQECV